MGVTEKTLINQIFSKLRTGYKKEPSAMQPGEIMLEREKREKGQLLLRIC